ncbi:MAG TPA: Ig-like domain-containing protein, partial [Verrucomicrobiae bacterium]|nr:Ig-like domain-containing protein [Verrucomicrobiae bacterium]
QAAIAPGPFSDGYFASIPGSTNSGFWDLGEAGTITVTIPNAPAGAYKYVWVQVAQYIGGVFPNYATVALPGGTLLQDQHVFYEPVPPLGNIYVDQSLWRIDPSPSSETLTITSAANGGLIDAVVVDTWAVSDPNIFVDDDYTSLGNCTAVGWPYNNPPQDKFIGQNAFATLQQGIAAEPTNGTLSIASGSYTGPILFNKGVTIVAGPNGDAAAVAVSGDIAFSSDAILRADLNGSTPGAGYDQWVVNGDVNLGGATLVLNDSTALPQHTTITLIDNEGANPVSGTFAALPEGAIINGLNQQFRISYMGGTGNDVTLTVIEHAPIAATDFLSTSTNTPVTVPISVLLQNDTDLDGDAISFVSASAPPGNGAVSFDATTVTYTPPVDFTGSNWFSYVIQDSQGVSATGRVDVLVGYSAAPVNIASISTPDSGASFALVVTGLAGRTYSMQRAPFITGPWTAIGSVHMDPGGSGTFIDATPLPTMAFYRAAYP